MEWAIHIGSSSEIGSSIADGHFDNIDAGSKLRPVVAAAVELARQYFGSIEFTRCVYGNEFCEHLIPGQEQLSETLNAATKHDLAFTFVTPYVTDAGIGSLRPLFELLDSSGRDCEVVFNDWGVLNLLRREFRRLVPVQGRLMNKSLRDPRITGMYATAETPGPALVTLRRSNLDCESYTSFLVQREVGRVELDNLPQGTDLSFTGSGIKTSIYFPFGFISTSRVCMAAGVHYRRRDKFQPGAPCRHECQTHLLEYTYSNSPFSNRDEKFYLKGNTYFYAHSEPMLHSLFKQAREGIVSRLVCQPRLPMAWERMRHTAVSGTS